MSPLRRSRPIRRTRRGIEISLPDDERLLLAGLASQLRSLLVAGDDPDLRRLFPPAHANDQRRNEEYRELVHDTLLEGRLAALDTFEETLQERTLSEEHLGCWMGAVNDLRLVLGTRLDVSEEDHAFDPEAPDAHARAVYHYLGWVLEEIVAVMAGSLPDRGDE
jgi:hypothetical protein